jgi:hypothetical protein
MIIVLHAAAAGLLLAVLLQLPWAAFLASPCLLLPLQIAGLLARLAAAACHLVLYPWLLMPPAA